jgi:hypothetical protein
MTPDSSLGDAIQIKSRVISLRLPKALSTCLERSSGSAKLSLPGGLDLLLRCSFSNCELLAQLKDCPDLWDAKLDARIPVSTFLQLKFACQRIGISISVYIRRLLYHFYATKKLKIVESNGHYTLAYRHD